MYMISRNDPTGTSASSLAEWGVERWRGFSLNEKGTVYMVSWAVKYINPTKKAFFKILGTSQFANFEGLEIT